MLTKIFQFLRISPNLRTFLCPSCLSSFLWCPDYPLHKAASGVWLAGMGPQQPFLPVSASTKGLVTRSWARAQHRVRLAREGKGELISSLLPSPHGEGCDSSRGSGFSHKVPRGLALQDLLGLWLLQMQACLCSCPQEHLLGDTWDELVPINRLLSNPDFSPSTQVGP